MTHQKTYIVSAYVVLTLLSGVISGYIGQRWGPGPELQAAAVRVAAMPTRLGSWQAPELTKLGTVAEKMLRCAGNVVGAYRQESTGEQVSVVMMVGPAGPLANHTPDICYRSSNYSIQGRPTQTKIVDSTGEVHDFLVVTLRENSAASRMLRVYYSWNMNQRWTAPASPRTTFAGVPMLYKIQVAAHVTEETSDAAESFLKTAIPLIKSIYTPAADIQAENG